MVFLELPVFLPGMESGWRVIRVASVVWRVFHRWMLDPPYLFFVLARALANKFRHVKDKMRRLNRVSYREDVAP